MKKIQIFLLVLIVIGIGLLATQKLWLPSFTNFLIKEEQSSTSSKDYKNIEYTIAGSKIELVSGVASTSTAPGSASKMEVRYFGNEVKKDLDGDGREDVAFLLTQTTGGSGTFYYVVGALNKESGYVGTDAVFIGDRIAPQTTQSGEGRTIIINYADRKSGESFSVKPSLGKSIILLLNPNTMQFGEVVKDFEGEADPSRMTLGMKTWVWQKTLLNDGTVTTPKKPGKFTLTFNKNGTFSAPTDCNGVGGEYSTRQSAISFTLGPSTLMYCEGSQETEFRNMIRDSVSYHFTSKGELILDLKYDSGSVIFR